MFYPKRDLKTIYSKDNTLSAEHLLELMNSSSKELKEYRSQLLTGYVKKEEKKLTDQNKTPEEIQKHISSPEFFYKASSYADYKVNHGIEMFLISQIGNKVKILNQRIKSLGYDRQSMILHGMYKISLLTEINSIIKDMSDDDFKELLEVIISCSHLKTDLTEQQQQSRQAAVAEYVKESKGFSMEKVREKAEELTGIDIANPIASLRKKFGADKPEGKQHMVSMDEKLVQTVINPFNSYYFILGALAIGLEGFIPPLVPILLIAITGKSLFSLVTEDKDKEGSVHSPFQEGIIRQPVTAEGQQNYTAMLERQKKEESEQQSTSPTSKKL
ncbi:hypothetical protein [Ehrlichia canis]|uniref:Uncharacterized protein n=1 Tax=Ehrlichia canis (strain Jake) TaxID=269484 RepID=A0ACA6AVF9_EHRCJ|nr:hypothetical protein [Ehrlichia canis]AAZ68318.1 hypothetical protein Ecaj_0271 [Ehrlichia canis str. Jake]AUO54921.1 hypothetical protein C1I72_03495 [Ehrlichia canis]UKC53295.1 hypothetical protein s20019040002_000338 [Ehrlichia canis]UKC54232.1 hypothetical protein s20026770001_000338 [Ehrlichia canis]UKC55168.1 hypothetical protein s21009500007_000338 [Ehrlichia canis]